MKSRMAWRRAPRSSSRGRSGPRVREAGRAISDPGARLRDADGTARARGLPSLEVQQRAARYRVAPFGALLWPAAPGVVERRHDAERDVGRLVVLRLGVRDVVRERANGCRP